MIFYEMQKTITTYSDINSSIAKNQHSELRVQGKNDKFRMYNSYGNDSCLLKDKN